jgi:uncharacterized protein YegJ (DUF2314 family)
MTDKNPQNRGVWWLIGAVVLGLGVVIAWSLPNSFDKPQDDGASSRGASESDGAVSESKSTKAGSKVQKPKEAVVEFAVVTDKSESDLGPLLDPKNLSAWLTLRHCGASCDQVRTLISDKDHFETEVIKTDDYILPPEDSWLDVARSLSDADRKRMKSMPNVVVVKAHGPFSPAHWPARAGFAATAAIAEHLGGYVYDETLRRIETAPVFATHALVEVEGESLFRPDRIVVQAYRTDDGTTRLLTLGMLRFGVFDIELQNAPSDRTNEASLVVNRAAEHLTKGEPWPFSLRPADVASLYGHEPGDAGSGSVEFDFVSVTPTEGDPENVMGSLTPRGVTSVEAALARLFGPRRAFEVRTDDPRLRAIADKARAKLGILRKARDAGANLVLKARFGGDGGVEEQLWVRTTSCDTASCVGILENVPNVLGTLQMGDTVRVEYNNVVDYLLFGEDGGREGGESEEVLQAGK